MKKKYLVGLAAPIMAAFAWLSLGGSSGHERISGAEARQLVERGARLVDVRTPSEFGAKHIPGATNIPVQQLGQRMKELDPRDKPIVLYCRTGHRSGIAFDKLHAAGFTSLYDLGSMTAW